MEFLRHALGLCGEAHPNLFTLLAGTPILGYIIYKLKNYYGILLAKVEVRMENDRGRIQKIRELYCVEAESVTEAEAKVIKDFEGDNTEYQVKEVKETKILKILE